MVLGGLEVDGWDVGVLSCARLSRDSLAWVDRVLEGV